LRKYGGWGNVWDINLGKYWDYIIMWVLSQ